MVATRHQEEARAAANARVADALLPRQPNGVVIFRANDDPSVVVSGEDGEQLIQQLADRARGYLERQGQDARIGIDVSDVVCKISTLRPLRRLWEDYGTQVVSFKATNVLDSIRKDEEMMATFAVFDGWFENAARLRDVDLSHNAFKDLKGIQMLNSVFGLRLERLVLYDCALTGKAVKYVNENISHPGHLMQLIIGRCPLEESADSTLYADDLAALLNKCPALLVCKLIATRPNAAGTRMIVMALLQRCAHIRKFYLEEANLSTSVPILQNALRGWQNLTELSVPDTSLTTAHLEDILDTIETSGIQLVFLNVGGNGIEQEGAEMLVRRMTREGHGFGNLQVLRMHASCFGIEGLQSLVPLLTSQHDALPQLRTLDLENNQFEDDEAANLLLESLGGMTLETLVLTDNLFYKHLAQMLLDRFNFVQIGDFDDIPN